MIAVIATIAAAVALGWPLVARSDAAPSAAIRIGTAFLLGTGLIAFAMFMLSVLGIGWSRVSLLTALVVLLALLMAASRKRSRATKPEEENPVRGFSLFSAIADLVTATLVMGHGLYATAAAPFETDFLSIWGLKGRVFFEHGGVDWPFLASPWNFFSHADYPLLLPLLYDAVAVLGGGWNDRWLGILTTAFGAAGLLAVRGLLARELTPRYAALITLTLASLVLSPWIGMAEAPLIAYGTVALLFVRRGATLSMEKMRGDELQLGALLLACAAMTKNEGMTLTVAAAAGVLVATGRARGSLVWRLWPAFAASVAWWLVTLMFRLENDLTAGSPFERILNADLGQLANLLWTHGGGAVPWMGLGLAALVALPELLRRERFLLTAVVVQLGFYLAAYVITPNGMEWQVRWSWARLITHLLPLVTLAFLISLSRILDRKRDDNRSGESGVIAVPITDGVIGGH